MVGWWKSQKQCIYNLLLPLWLFVDTIFMSKIKRICLVIDVFAVVVFHWSDEFIWWSNSIFTSIKKPFLHYSVNEVCSALYHLFKCLPLFRLNKLVMVLFVPFFALKNIPRKDSSMLSNWMCWEKALRKRGFRSDVFCMKFKSYIFGRTSVGKFLLSVYLNSLIVFAVIE